MTDDDIRKIVTMDTFYSCTYNLKQKLRDTTLTQIDVYCLNKLKDLSGSVYLEIEETESALQEEMVAWFINEYFPTIT